MTTPKLNLAIYLPDLSGGGAERLHVSLVGELARLGIQPRFLLNERRGELLDQVHKDVPIDVLGATRQIAALPKLVRWLRRDPPDVLVANMEHMCVIAVLARAISRAKTQIIIVQHNSLGKQLQRPGWRWRVLLPLFRSALRRADAVVAVSSGVADEMSELTDISRTGIQVIPNGIVHRDFIKRSLSPVSHPWLRGKVPLIIGMGRLVDQKDFETLIRAFAKLLEMRDARLIILGDGPLRGDLGRLVSELNLEEKTHLPGFRNDAPAWLRQADLFVLSSRYEGFGNVVAEALALGTPVVSTDCPFGPAEILQGGLFGTLVPPGDSAALAQGMLVALADKSGADVRIARGLSYSVEGCATAYASLFHSVISPDCE